MNSIAISVLMLLSAGIPGFTWQEPAATQQPAATVTLHCAGRLAPDEALQSKLKDLAMELLKTSNFNTLAHPHIMKQSVPQVHERYRLAAAEDHLVITYDQPFTVHTVGGDVSVYEIVVGLARPDFVSSLFTIDAEGRVAGHGKYYGGKAIELRQAVGSPAGANHESPNLED